MLRGDYNCSGARVKRLCTSWWMKWAPSPPTGDQTSTSNSFRWKKGKKCFWRKFFSQSMWLESPITFLHCVHEARMKKIVHLPPPSEKQIYIVQVVNSGLYIETWLIWHYFQDWLSICQKSKLSNKKTFSSSPLSDKNGNPRYCGDNVLLGELWSQQNKPWGNETQKLSSFFSKWNFWTMFSGPGRPRLPFERRRLESLWFKGMSDDHSS